jgi:hypothetical protein
MRKDEIAVYNQIAESAAKQISESRSFFERMFKNTLYASGIIVSVAIGFFFYFNGKTSEEFKAALQKEMRAQVEKEFDKDEIKKLVRSVAEDQTKKTVLDLAPAMIAKELKIMHEPTIQGYNEALCSPTIKNGAVTLSWSSIMPGCSSIVTLVNITTKEDTIITLPKPLAGKSASILVTYGGAHKITWTGGGSILWANNAVPNMVGEKGKKDYFSCMSVDSINTLCNAGGRYKLDSVLNSLHTSHFPCAPPRSARRLG